MADIETLIRLPLYPKQAEFVSLVESSPATQFGYGGSRGGSKSDTLRKIKLKRRFEKPNTWGLILRRRWAELQENHIEPMFREWPMLREWYNTQEHTIKFPEGGGIRFRSAEHGGDIFSLQGSEYYDIAVDQAEQFTEAELVFLKTCNRWPNTPESACKMFLFFNPGGVGHAYLKRVFFDKKYKDKENPADFVFHQAYGWDNAAWALPALTADGLTVQDYFSWTDEQRFQYFITRTQYGRELDALPQAMRIGHLLGKLDQFAGQYFDIFDTSKLVRPELMGIKDWHTRWLGLDWGFAHPTVCYWNAQTEQLRTKTYKEFAINATGARAVAQEIVDRCSDAEKKAIRAIFLSPDAFAKRNSENTIAEQMGEVFRANKLPYPTPADDDRVGGWHLMYEMLRTGEWEIGDNCEELISVLPMMTRDDKKPEDCIKFDGDDAADAARYALKSFLGPSRKPLEVRVAERLAEMPGVKVPSLIPIAHAIAMNKEKQAHPQGISHRRRSWRWQGARQ
jgi:phage terminase large subunit